MKRLLLLTILILVSLPGISHAEPRDGLVGYWTFDGKDTPNGRINDVSGNGNHGNTSGISTTTFYKPGKIGQSGNFDGTDDKVTFTAPLTSSTFTLSFWFNPQKGGNTYQSLIFQGTTRGLYWRTANKISYYDNAADHLNNTTITPERWHHIVVTSNAGTITYYVDTVSDGGFSGANTFAPTNFGFDTAGEAFGGKMDDVRIYNRVLNPNEVTQLYNYGQIKHLTANIATSTQMTSSLFSNLEGWWTMDGIDTLGGVIRDRTTNNNNGNITSIATSTFYSSGKIAQAVTLDGVNDKITIPDNPGIRPGTKAFSYSLWFNAPKTIQAGPIITKEQPGSPFRGFGIYIADCTTSQNAGRRINIDVIGSNSGTDVWWYCTTDDIADGKWHYLTFVRPTSGDAIIYIDGLVAATTLIRDSNTEPQDMSNTDNLFLGNDQGSKFFTGSVDDVRTYSKALSATEVLQLYNYGRDLHLTPNMATSTNMVIGANTALSHLLTFDGKDISNGVARDAVNADTRANLLNIATSTFYDTGKIGQGFNFDGTDDRVLISPSISSGSNSFNFSMWINPSPNADNYQTILTQDGTKGLFMRGPGGSNLALDYFEGGDRNSVVRLNYYKWNFVSVNVTTAPSVTYCVNLVCDAPVTSGAITIPNVNSIGDDPSSETFKGKIDDVRIYSKTLSTAEMTQLYNFGQEKYK